MPIRPCSVWLHCPYTECCLDALLQDKGTTRRRRDKMSQGSEEWDGNRVMGEPFKYWQTIPLHGVFFTPVYRASVWSWIQTMWGKTVVTYDRIPSLKPVEKQRYVHRILASNISIEIFKELLSISSSACSTEITENVRQLIVDNKSEMQWCYVI